MTRRILITSAIPYVAGVKHLGNLVGSMLPADIFARYCRSRGYDTLAICATDEHGPPVSGAQDIETRDSTHLFLKQSQFADKLRARIDSHKADWPQLVTSIAYKWLDEGLQDRGITRDLEWGIPVPDDIADGQLKGKVFYVWFAATIEYIALSLVCVVFFCCFFFFSVVFVFLLF